LKIDDGCALVPQSAGLGIDWRWAEIERRAIIHHHIDAKGQHRP
jgi:hypothetical protein